MEDLIDDNELDKARPGSLAAYFPQLTLYNSQYSCVRFDDTDDDCQNITNLDNGTSKEEYEPSGHFVKIFDAAHPYRCTYDSRESKLLARQIMDTNYNLMADGTEYDPTDQAGEGFDVMLGSADIGIRESMTSRTRRSIFLLVALPLSHSLRQ